MYRRQRSVLHTGERAESSEDGIGEDAALLEARVALLRQLCSHGQQVARLDPDVERVQLQEAAHHQPGAGEQHERQRQLGDHHHRGQPARTAAAGGAATTFFEDVVDVGPRDLKRGRQAEEDAGRNRDQRRSIRRRPDPC